MTSHGRSYIPTWKRVDPYGGEVMSKSFYERHFRPAPAVVRAELLEDALENMTAQRDYWRDAAHRLRAGLQAEMALAYHGNVELADREATIRANRAALGIS